MNALFNYLNEDSQFFTMVCILGGAFLVGCFYLHEETKEYELQAMNEWDEMSNSFSELSRMMDISGSTFAETNADKPAKANHTAT